jgi:hypothetical protein
MSDEGRNKSTQGWADEIVMDAIELADTTLKPVQLSDDIRVHSKHGTYRLTPQPTITAYQSLRITMLLFVVANARVCFAIDDVFKSVLDETAEHWTRIE